MQIPAESKDAGTWWFCPVIVYIVSAGEGLCKGLELFKFGLLVLDAMELFEVIPSIQVDVYDRIEIVSHG